MCQIDIDVLSSVCNHIVHILQGMHNKWWKYLHIVNVCDVKLHVQEIPFFIIFLICLMTMSALIIYNTNPLNHLLYLSWHERQKKSSHVRLQQSKEARMTLKRDLMLHNGWQTINDAVFSIELAPFSMQSELGTYSKNQKNRSEFTFPPWSMRQMLTFWNQSACRTEYSALLEILTGEYQIVNCLWL